MPNIPLPVKMIGLGRQMLLNSGGCWKRVEAFLVGEGEQWAVMLGEGAFRIHGRSQEFKTSYNALDRLTQNTRSTPTENTGIVDV